MTYPSLRIARLVFPALALASLSAAGCVVGTGCKLNCGDSGVFVKVPTTESVEGATVMTDPSCTAQLARPQTDIEIYVVSPNAGTCRVRVRLTNGDTYAFSVDFRSNEFSCCGTVIRAVDASIPELTDGGIGAPG